MLSPRRERPDSIHQDVVELADAMAAVRLPKDYRQSGQEYRDFRAVLVDCTADKVQARRVLTRIFHWGSLMAPVHEEGDPYATHVRIGAQQLCQRILMALNTIPNNTSEEQHDG
ncbi:MAG: hypothetical protein GKS00_21965 [Alphaproteobacteria bacterium]|nr:hypothetical protein [Alphaproteobacteria bacterium]